MRIVEVPPPTSPDDPNTWVLRAEHALVAAHQDELFGHADLVSPLASFLAFAVPYEARSSVRWAALGDTEADVLGYATLHLTHLDNQALGMIDVGVRADVRRRGVGTALMAALEAGALARGRTTLIGYATQPVCVSSDSPDALAPASGHGHLDGRHPAARFALARGYRLEQVEAHSVLTVALSAPRLATLDPAPVAGYSLVSWRDRCPDELVVQLAGLYAAMSTAAPDAGLGYEAQRWDAARVREVERRRAGAGHHALVTAVRHDATGELVGYTELTHHPDVPAFAGQEDTLVLPAHRGHRLGMALKVANLRRLAEAYPSVERIHTWNADENEHMRAINRALGFVQVAAEGAWQKRLTPSS